MVIKQIIKVHTLLNNPHQYAATVLAKLCTNVATLIWAAIVILKADAIKLWPGSSVFHYLSFSYLEGEDILAFFLVAVSAVAGGRLLAQAKPIAIGTVFYGILATFWMYVLFSLLVSVQFGITAARPGQISSVLVVTALALFAFIANPKKRNCDDALDN